MPRKTIADTHPDVATDLHATKNGNLTALDLAPYDNKQVWWRCSKGHEARVSVYTRIRVGCKECNRELNLASGKFVRAQAAKRGSLKERSPELLARWDYEKNGELGIDPEHITASSNRDVFWICPMSHSYSRSPKREQVAVHCPDCYEQNKSEIISKNVRVSRLDEDNTFADAFPVVAFEWDHERNLRLPNEYAPFSNAKVWWKCAFGHSWSAQIYNRTIRKSGCPHCRIGASRMELFVYAELKAIFPTTKLKAKIDKVEADVFMPELSTVVEIDGDYWHRDKVNKDRAKDLHMLQRGIRCYRMRQRDLPHISDFCVTWEGTNFLEDTKSLFRKIQASQQVTQFDSYLSRTTPLNPELYDEIVARLPAPQYEDSLAVTHPHIASEWDDEANGYLLPSMFTSGSDQKLAWRCGKCGHQWPATIKNRTLRKSGCPECAVESSRKPRPICPVCGKKCNSLSATTCSPDCAGRFKRVGRKTTQCRNCEQTITFRETESERIFCSKECYFAAKEKCAKPKHLLGKTALKVCKACGNEFWGESWIDRKFCSQACFRQDRSKTTDVVCEHCGVRFVNKTSRKRRFCSQACWRASPKKSPLHGD